MKNKIAGTVAAAVSGFILFGFFSMGFAQSTAQSNAPISSFFTQNYGPTDRVLKKDFSSALARYLSVSASSNRSCYRDLDRDDASTPYICALKRARIFKTARSFLPNSNVKWDFVIKSICTAQNWTRSKSFSSCKSFATRNDLLPSSVRIRPKMQVSYLDLEYLLEHARNIQPRVEQPQTQQPGTTTTVQSAPPALQTPSAAFTPVNEQEISPTFFSNITLTAPIPNRFYLNEVYFIEGDFTNGVTADQVFVFLCRAGQGCSNSIDYLESTNGSSHFRIPVYFKEAGNFQIGMIPGRSGQSRITDISVMPQAPEPAGGTVVTNLSVSYNAGKTYFSWSGAAAGSFTRLVVFQDQERKDYIFRQGTISYAPSSEDFANFHAGAANWFVKNNSTQSPTSQISLTVQEFRKIENASVQTQMLQESFASPTNFTFRGRSLVPISKRAAVTLPSGQVEEINFSQNDLPAQQDFTVNFNITTRGTYIFEINNPEGGAVVNVPIYVGTDIPLLPDFFALNPPELDPSPMTELNSARQTLLNLINADRSTYSLPPVQLNEQINNIAQSHSLNMVNLIFFGHVDPSGNGPDARRRNASYNVNIRENLAKASSLELAQRGLMRSPIHRAVLMDPAMRRVGLGIVKNSEGYYLVTQNFSAAPTSSEELTNTTTNLFSQANVRRSSAGLAPLSRDSALESLATDWSRKMATENFFSLTDQSGTSLVSKIREQGINSAIQISILQVSATEQLLDELLSQESLVNSTNTKIGLGLAVNGTGDVLMTVIYSS